MYQCIMYASETFQYSFLMVFVNSIFILSQLKYYVFDLF